MIFDKQVTDALNKMEKEKIRAKDFEGGLTLQFKKAERVKSQYGASEDSSIVERGILDEGEQFVFTFADKDGDTRRFFTTSLPFVVALNNAEINADEWVTIKRTGQAKETKYTVTK